MSRLDPKDRFWAGGSGEGWFVKFHREPSWHPGAPEESTIAVFAARDYVDGETGASKAASALATDLNQALDKVRTSA